MRGVVNMMDDAVASSTCGSALMNRPLEPKKISERNACSRGFVVNRTASPRVGRNSSSIHTRWPRKRAHTTCHTGKSIVRDFATAFIAGSRLTASTMKPMPRSRSGAGAPGMGRRPGKGPPEGC